MGQICCQCLEELKTHKEYKKEPLHQLYHFPDIVHPHVHDSIRLYQTLAGVPGCGRRSGRLEAYGRQVLPYQVRTRSIRLIQVQGLRIRRIPEHPAAAEFIGTETLRRWDGPGTSADWHPS